MQPRSRTHPLIDHRGSALHASAGEVVIPAKYGMAMPFVDAVAGVAAADDGWIFIDRTGKKLATAFVFDSLELRQPALAGPSPRHP